MRESFVFYKSFFEAIENLPRDVRGEAYSAICRYALYGESMGYTGECRGEQLKPIAQCVLSLVKPQLDANYSRFVNGCKGGDYGKLGGRPKKPLNNPKETPKKPLKNPTQTPNVNDNDIITFSSEKDNNGFSNEKPYRIVKDTCLSGKNQPRARANAAGVHDVAPTVVDLKTGIVHGDGWRKDFESYKSSLRQCYMALKSDAEWIAERKRLNPRVDVVLTLEKVCVEYWATEEGWAHKKKSKAEINWKTTLAKSVGAKFTQVYENDTRGNQGGKGAVSDEFRTSILRDIGAI